MFRKIYDKMLEAAHHKSAKPILFVIAFAESSFFPIPPDVMLLPMVLAERYKAFIIAFIATLGSVLGGVFGYLIGFYLFDIIGQPIIDFYHAQSTFDKFANSYNEYGSWVVFTFGLTPLPYKVITIGSGFTNLNIFAFIAASVASRGLRFFAEATLLYFFGEQIRNFIETKFNLVVSLLCILLVGGFLVLALI